MTDFVTARTAMVDSQLRPNEVNETSITKAMLSVPRERFVPKAKRAVAYVDEDIEVASGRYIMEPRVFGRLLSAATVQSTDLVLDIAPATGYSSAVLSQMADAVVALEADKKLVESAESKLAEIDAVNVAVIDGDMAKGVAKQGPFDVIVINGAVEEVPKALIKQLKDGGRLVCVLIEGGVGRGHLVKKTEDGIEARHLFDANARPVPGFQKEEAFTFA
ncbi:protein-L-isoaspartate O-methyltransferase [Temperatibacter marinus]|uniref:Protein-L-isoaspartate O-methyltransferase n=1 Tax=Temperatibacter marinus TaxID=1456591 RepID=A0AA52EFW3_9PROT|nr:protein-L-isoaspartate O-methyltransferase [Temperatibacter marinus]WND01774.1 protein-L-isoaspartate O-methyltransferase [Temperatibacter marinus]